MKRKNTLTKNSVLMNKHKLQSKKSSSVRGRRFNRNTNIHGTSFLDTYRLKECPVFSVVKFYRITSGTPDNESILGFIR